MANVSQGQALASNPLCLSTIVIAKVMLTHTEPAKPLSLVWVNTGTRFAENPEPDPDDTFKPKSSLRKRKAQPLVAETPDSEAGPSVPAKKQKKAAITKVSEWTDIPRWESSRSPLMEMPVEIWDKIFGSDSGLVMQDYLALSGTCRQIRAAFTPQIWKGLHDLHYFSRPIGPVIRHIFSTASPVGGSPMASLSDASCNTYKDRVVTIVDDTKLPATDARKTYKVTEKELMRLPYTVKPNPHRRSGSPMKLFNTARVRALAYRLHGGPLGHAAHLKKLAEKDAKAKATRKQNGTTLRKQGAAVAGPITFPHMMVSGLWSTDSESDSSPGGH
ncbi:hypothetical protein BV22DRAFT_32241 [Leucogyrophana mollusca]|uniref:Uncharacterized protein n=1 Tax=Leucogyrophana mollusca TaxID=85980 RepID=A0ACB8C122_9AGAM|nr:hypothetical protein BV22DRAFT_32241 [Leucogyrophana mollusca]